MSSNILIAQHALSICDLMLEYNKLSFCMHFESMARIPTASAQKYVVAKNVYEATFFKIQLAVTPCDASLDVVCRQEIRLSKQPTRLSTVSLKDNHLVKKTCFSFKASLWSCAFLLFSNNLQILEKIYTTSLVCLQFLSI